MDAQLSRMRGSLDWVVLKHWFCGLHSDWQILFITREGILNRTSLWSLESNFTSYLIVIPILPLLSVLAP